LKAHISNGDAQSIGEAHGYYDEHDRAGIQRTIADAIALTLTGERGAS
jgi:hypothetical protein